MWGPYRVDGLHLDRRLEFGRLRTVLLEQDEVHEGIGRGGLLQQTTVHRLEPSCLQSAEVGEKVSPLNSVEVR